jgi:copper homeostasis protein
MLEIACFNAPSAIAAAKAGASRIELCADYAAGGVTPILSTLHSIREELDASSNRTSPDESPSSSHDRVPINVMIRPRGGDFTYSTAELSEICLRRPDFRQ